VDRLILEDQAQLEEENQGGDRENFFPSMVMAE